MRRALLTLVTTLLALGLTAPTAVAHEERPATFPDGSGRSPAFLGLDNPRHRVVCKRDSRKRIARLKAGPVKRRNKALLKQCRFHSIQDAVDSIKRRRTSIYVLPGVYTERKWARAQKSSYCGNLRKASTSPLRATSYIGSISAQAVPEGSSSAQRAADDPGPIALSYADQRRCAHNLNLIALFGDDSPGNGSIRCDNRLCGTQIVGTGRKPGQVRIDNKFAKLNAIRADRVSGIYLRNFLVQQAEFNAIYVMETDGFVVDRVVARGQRRVRHPRLRQRPRHDQELAHLLQRGLGHLPGLGVRPERRAARSFEARRYAIEIFGNDSHHNTVGYSGTAGNSVYAHDNKFHHNSAGLSTDSLVPGPPRPAAGPRRWTDNRIYSNNENYYSATCDSGRL